MAQDPRWPDKSHFEPFLIVFRGTTKERRAKRCQAWKNDHSAQCGNAAMAGFEVCRKCGGAAAKKNKSISSRRAFQEVLAGEDSTHVHELIGRLHSIAKAGNLDAIKYILDQIYGTAKATVVNEIGNRDLLAAMIRITAQFIKGEEFQEWLNQAKLALAESESTT